MKTLDLTRKTPGELADTFMKRARLKHKLPATRYDIMTNKISQEKMADELTSTTKTMMTGQPWLRFVNYWGSGLISQADGESVVS